MITNLSNERKPHVLVIGDLMLDEYIEGDVHRLSPEAPVPVVLVDKERAVPGGAGNVVRNLVSLGAQVTVAGLVGDDAYGTALLALLERGTEKVNTSCVLLDAGRPTTKKTRIVAGGSQIVRVDREMTYPIDVNTADYIFKMIGKLDNFDAIIVSDYGKGVVTPYVFNAIMEQAQLFDVFVAVDPSGTDYSKYLGANIITPNLKEAEGASGSDSVVEMAKIIMEEAELPQLLITLGEDGMDLFEQRDYYHLDADKRDVFDVAGAGDTVIAALTLSVAAGDSIRRAANIANIAAGIVVSKSGTATVSLEELLDEIEQRWGDYMG